MLLLLLLLLLLECLVASGRLAVVLHGAAPHNFVAMIASQLTKNMNPAPLPRLLFCCAVSFKQIGTALGCWVCAKLGTNCYSIYTYI